MRSFHTATFQFQIVQAGDGSGKGAALIAAIASKLNEKESPTSPHGPPPDITVRLHRKSRCVLSEKSLQADMPNANPVPNGDELP